ncbi:hypothetical protein DL93DRAFT_2227765 [Clavulina sp. PMI_390]|nr:hypothetical protein DL93DRAFT_2227765 [Clavulina sp. PMI_390]
MGMVTLWIAVVTDDNMIFRVTMPCSILVLVLARIFGSAIAADRAERLEGAAKAQVLKLIQDLDEDVTLTHPLARRGPYVPYDDPSEGPEGGKSFIWPRLAQRNEYLPRCPVILEKLNFDVIFAIVSWLDPLSVLRLGWTCKVFLEAIDNNILVWRRALRNVCTEHCIAPHSLPGLSIDDLKRYALRPIRLAECFRDLKRPLHATIEECVLSYPYFFSSEPSSDINFSPRVQFLAPHLLPGGRWILSGAINDGSLTTYLFCWDRLAALPDSPSMQPVAVFTWEGLRPKDTGNWLKYQLHASQTVSLAFALQASRSYDLTYDVLCMSWATDPPAPRIERVARLPHDSEAMKQYFFPKYDIHGDYMIFNSRTSITIWDWKENLIGSLDQAHQEWADGSAFFVTALLPFIFIIPHDMREMLILELPKLHPIGSSEATQLVRPISTTSRAFLANSDGLVYSNLFILESWKPPSLRAGLAVAMSRRSHVDGNLFHVLSLRSTNTPQYSPQLTTSPFPYADDDFGRTTVVSPPCGGMLILNRLLSSSAKQQPIATLFFPFAEGDSIGEPFEREVLPPQDRHTGKLGPLCPVLGAAIFRDRRHGPQTDTNIVRVVFFDCDRPEEGATA